MATNFETVARLLTALEELVLQETALIRTMDFVEAVELRERAAPIVEKLCVLAGDLPGVESPDPAVAAVRARFAGLLERSGQNYHFLATQLARLQSELDRVSEARGRLRHLAPAYQGYRRVATVGESRLNTAA
jgi:hypothetical protein